MSETQKPLSDRDYQHTLRASYNNTDKSLSVSGFLTAKVGHKVVLTITTTTITNDTEVYAFTDTGNALYTLTIIYTDGTRSNLLSAERTA
jgi:hypothetical protein